MDVWGLTFAGLGACPCQPVESPQFSSSNPSATVQHGVELEHCGRLRACLDLLDPSDPGVMVENPAPTAPNIDLNGH